MTFKPANDDHAVVDCQFALGFDRPLTVAEMSRIHDARPQWTDRLPAQAIVDLEPGEIVGRLPPGTPRKALTYSIMRPDGSFVWSLRCTPTDLVVLCSQYTRWGPTWRTAFDLLSRVIGSIIGHENAADSVKPPRRFRSAALYVEDRFSSFDGGGRTNSVLKSNEWIGDRLGASSELWHCNAGWFQNHESTPCLNQLNVAVTREDEAKAHHLQISHSQELHLLADGAAALTIDEQALCAVDRWMNVLHQSNKSLLTDLLTSEMAGTIKLGGDAA
jgi:hypothetical protein